MKRKRHHTYINRVMVPVRLPKEYLEKLDLLIKGGFLVSRTEGVEAALENLLAREGVDDEEDEFRTISGR